MEGRDSAGGNEFDISVVPLMASISLVVPFDALHVYGGFGLGVVFFDVEEIPGLPSDSDDGDFIARCAFLGLRVHLGDRFLIGVEGEYFDTVDSEDRVSKPFSGYTLSTTLGVRLFQAAAHL